MDSKDYDIVEISDREYKYHYRPFRGGYGYKHYIPKKSDFRYYKEYDNDSYFYYKNDTEGEKIYGRRVVFKEDAVAVEERAFRKDISITEVVLNEGMVTIGKFAFDRCRALQHIEIPGSVRRIEEGAFWGCKNLESVIIPEGVQYIDRHAFIYCTALKSIVIPKSVTHIGSGAFYGCENLDTLVILGKIRALGNGEFLHCDKLQKVLIYNNTTNFIDIKAFSEYGPSFYERIRCFISTNHRLNYIKDKPHKKSLLTGIIRNHDAGKRDLYDLDRSDPAPIDREEYRAMNERMADKTDESIPNRYTLEDGTLTISTDECMVKRITFENIRDQVRHVILPESVTCIGQDAFSDCMRLESVKGSRFGVIVRSGAFRNCENLKKLPDLTGTTIIGEDTFAGCKSLEQVTIPDGVISVSSTAFIGCSNLKNIRVPILIFRQCWCSIRDHFSTIVNIQNNGKNISFPLGLCHISFLHGETLHCCKIKREIGNYPDDFSVQCLEYKPVFYDNGRYESLTVFPIIELEINISNYGRTKIINIIENITFQKEELRNMLENMKTSLKFWNTNPEYPYHVKQESLCLDIEDKCNFSLKFFPDEGFAD